MLESLQEQGDEDVNHQPIEPQRKGIGQMLRESHQTVIALAVLVLAGGQYLPFGEKEAKANTDTIVLRIERLEQSYAAMVTRIENNNDRVMIDLGRLREAMARVEAKMEPKP